MSPSLYARVFTYLIFFKSMTKTTIITVSVVFIVLTGFLVWGKSSQNIISISPPISSAQTALGSANSLIVSEKLYNFGTISMKNKEVEHNFKITNPTDRDIFLKKVVTSCMCTRAYIESVNGEKGPFGMEGMGYVPPANETIKAGESINIKAVYDPNAHGPAGVGFIDRFITLSDANGKALALEIKAVVTP